MKIELNQALLTGGAQMENDVLTLPAVGGQGVTIPGLSQAEERYLNVTMTVLEAHSMAFEMRAWGEGDEDPRVIIRFGLMPQYRANIAIDLQLLDGHILFPGHVPGELKVVCHGSRIARGEIVRAELVSMASYHDVHVKVEDLALEDAPRPAAQVPDIKLIDEMGQYIPKDWPGKIRDTEELVEKLRAQAGLPNAYPFKDWTIWGGCASRKLKEGTGFFSRIKKDGRWYLTDPDGCAFFSMGPDGVVARCDARVDGLEPLMKWLPDESRPEDAPLWESMRRHWGENGRGEGKLVSFERANLKRAFGEEWEETWRAMVVSQLKNAGMNTLGNWSDPTLFGRMPYVTSLPEFPGTRHRIFRDFPDVLSPEFEQEAQRCAQGLLPRRDDPWMIGYFLRNEPSWAFVDNLIIADEVLRDPEATVSKDRLISWLQEKYGDVAALNAAWGSGYADWEDFRQPREKTSAISAQAEADLRAFSAIMTEAYSAIPARACKVVDPNHMNLGLRWAWISDPALVAGCENYDVFSINCYAIDPTSAIEHVRELGVDMPVMIGEFHFGALDGGLTATGLEAVTSQAERGAAYRYYCEHVAAHPNGVGCHYFQCYDQFALGRFDGENYNIGLFDICLQPYKDMMAAVHACSEHVYAVNAGEEAPVDRKPESIPMVAY